MMSSSAGAGGGILPASKLMAAAVVSLSVDDATALMMVDCVSNEKYSVLEE